MNYLIIPLSLSAGFLSKTVDIIEDNKIKRYSFLSLILGILYGALLSYSASLSLNLSSFILGVIFSLFLSKKIDAKGHYLAMFSFFVSIFIFGFGGINFALLIVILLFSYLDELIDKKINFRFALDIACFVISLILNDFDIFAFIIFYDLSYLLMSKIEKKYFV